jgi:pyruvate kinase
LEQGFDFVANGTTLVKDAAVVAELFGEKGLRLFETISDGATLRQAYEARPSYVAAQVLMRGRLACAVPPETVPLAQRRLAAHSLASGMPFFVSEQCLDSMISQPIPSRADATDIASAIYEGSRFFINTCFSGILTYVTYE